jgi:hypothetical protein
MKNAAVRTNDTFTKEQKIEALKGNNESRNYLIREALTEEQKAKFDEMKAKQAAKKAEMKAKKGKKGAVVEDELDDEGL